MSSTRAPLLSVNLSAIAHATEDIGKVEQALRYLGDSVHITSVDIARRYMKGHHGNLIATVSAKLPSKEISRETLTVLFSCLSESDRRYLSDDLTNCIDEEGNLYLRFDKQEAYLGRLSLHQSDPIRMKLKFPSRCTPEMIASICKESGLIP
jgi:RNA binding exosome subunit